MTHHILFFAMYLIKNILFCFRSLCIFLHFGVRQSDQGVHTVCNKKLLPRCPAAGHLIYGCHSLYMYLFLGVSNQPQVPPDVIRKFFVFLAAVLAGKDQISDRLLFLIVLLVGLAVISLLLAFSSVYFYTITSIRSL